MSAPRKLGFPYYVGIASELQILLALKEKAGPHALQKRAELVQVARSTGAYKSLWKRASWSQNFRSG